jgi:uncharacterized protein
MNSSDMNIYARIISKELSLPEREVENTVQLLDEGCTIPFISRYRKERTGGMDEVKIAAISDYYDKLKELSKRKETVCKTIQELGKMTDELQHKIDNCWDSTELEDIYLPYKPKRRTKAQIAREQGLEPLATLMMLQRESNPENVAKRFVRGDVKDVAAAIKGAQDIIAENINEDERARQQLRYTFKREAVITSKVIKTKKDTDEAAKYSDYFDFSEPLKRCSGNRLLAMRRAENEGILRVCISVDDDEATEKLKRQFVRGYGPCQKLVGEAAEDAYKRLLCPSIETEFSALSKQAADEEAIEIFAENLRQLLLQAPLGQKRVIGVDPGIRTGCKVVCLDALGNLLHFEAVYPYGPKGNEAAAGKRIEELANKYQAEAIAVGNGTAGRSTSDILKRQFSGKPIQIFEVSEDGASVYSASQIARDEFPNEDITVRGAVSIGRRLMDPLAELVKIDPQSMGVGQYQHDVDQTKLKKSLQMVVESCVNSVGVNVNTASEPLLTYVSGLGPALAKNIIEYRRDNGPFTSRAQLKKVPRLGNSAYQQCAGFLRISDAKNPLDNSAVHPESYHIVESMAKDENCSVKELMENKQKRSEIDLKKYASEEVGMPTLQDIMKELEKPGRDPRAEIEVFEYDPRVRTINDLQVGMILPGIVTNITKFGAFVDVGIHQDGLVHISQLANKFVTDPTQVVKLHQHVQVKVLEIDTRRNRISLSMKI